LELHPEVLTIDQIRTLESGSGVRLLCLQNYKQALSMFHWKLYTGKLM